MISSYATAVIQVTIWLWQFHRKGSKKLFKNANWIFYIFFHCYASKKYFIPTPDSHSQIVNLFDAVEYGLYNFRTWIWEPPFHQLSVFRLRCLVISITTVAHNLCLFLRAWTRSQKSFSRCPYLNGTYKGIDNKRGSNNWRYIAAANSL